MPKIVIFDFDGTIADSLDVLIEVYNDVARRYRCKEVTLEEIEALRNGRFMKKLMAEHGITRLKAPFVLRAIRKGLHSQMHSTKPFLGMVEVLRELKDRGLELGIISSNTEENIRAFLNDHGLEALFSFVIYHRSLFGKHQAFRKLLRQRNLATSDVIYIGDEERDVAAARKAGIKSISVTWGYQTRKALELIAPDRLVDNPQELLSSI